MNPRMKTMDTPKTRAEFELRFNFLREVLQTGKMHIPSSLLESLLKLRHLPNGRLDFLSVDEMTRLQANTMFQLADFKIGIQEEEAQDFVGDE